MENKRDPKCNSAVSQWSPFSESLSICFLLVMLTLCGCGERNPYEVVPISGTVTFDGKPVAGVRIAFEPTVGRASFASTDAEGKFRAWYKDKIYGVQKGKVNVIFEKNLDDSVILGEHAKPSADVEEVLTLHGHGGTPIEIEITGPNDDLKIDIPAASD